MSAASAAAAATPADDLHGGLDAFEHPQVAAIVHRDLR